MGSNFGFSQYKLCSCRGHTLLKMPQYKTREEVQFGKNIYRNIYEDTAGYISAPRLLIAHWKGSVIRLIWKDFLTFIVLYVGLSILYRNILFDFPEAKEGFEILCVYSNRFSQLIPITFLIGFYVSSIVNRWWDQFMTLPRPDKLALKLVNFCPGNDDFNKNLRRTVMRYVNLSTVLVYRNVSTKAVIRFPDYTSLVDAKLMLPNEVVRLEKCDGKTPHESTWAPILWAMKLLTKARQEGKITVEAPIFARLQSEFDDIEAANRKILNYGWINFPLAYTQVTTMCVYFYFFAALFGRQYLIPNEYSMNISTFPNVNVSYASNEPFINHTPDLFVPFFTMIEFFCYVGWVKVAETLLNPFGDDDEDFKINYLIDRNLQVSYLIVDEADQDMDMGNDPFLEAGIVIPDELPYQDPRLRELKGDNLSKASSITSLAHATSSIQLNIFRRNRRRSSVSVSIPENSGQLEKLRIPRVYGPKGKHLKRSVTSIYH